MDVLKDYISTHGISSHHIDGYNALLQDGLREVIENECANRTSPIGDTAKPRVNIKNIIVDYPTIIDADRTIRPMYPTEARVRDITYDATVFVDIDYFGGNGDSDVQRVVRYPLFRIPIMVGSIRCNLTKSGASNREPMLGYFIIRGKERVLVSQERAVYNKIFTSGNSSGSTADIRSMSMETSHSSLTQCSVINDVQSYRIRYDLSTTNDKVDAHVIFKVLGIDVDILEKRILRPGLDTKERFIRRRTLARLRHEISVAENSLETLRAASRNKDDEPLSVLRHELFPHLGPIPGMYQIRYVIMELFVAAVDHCSETVKSTCKDHYKNKRIECSGVLVRDLFKVTLKRFLRNVTSVTSNSVSMLNVFNRYNNINKSLHYSFATGNWGSLKSTYMRTGVSQVLMRANYISALSHLRRLIVPVGREVKNTDVRAIHMSSVFFVDGTETPEGASVGVVKNFALTAKVTVGRSMDQIFFTLDSLGYRQGMFEAGATIITVNNLPYTVVSTDSKTLLTHLREARLAGILPSDVSIFSDYENKVEILCDEGRMIRPLFRIRALLKHRTDTIEDPTHDTKTGIFDYMVREKIIVWVDVDELETSVVAMTPEDIVPESEYMEIHPSAMLGVVSSVIPYIEHNQSPRICYYTNMGKQSMSWLREDVQNRMDTTLNILVEGQTPLIDTVMSKTLMVDRVVSGVNAIVAIMPLEGMNQEDSIIMNKAALDRGMFRAYVLRTVVVDDQKSSNAISVVMGWPPRSCRKTYQNYNKLDEDGFIHIGIDVQFGDVLVARYEIHRTLDEDGNEISTEYVDTSVICSHKDENAYIDRVWMTTTVDGTRIVKVRTRVLRIPELGDKFASRSAQKSTVGMIYSPEDMPFTSDGMVPDIIINPCAIPSRMTISQILETSSGIVTLEQGKAFGDASAWTQKDRLNAVSRELTRLGLKSDGTSLMMNGTTGQAIESRIYIGPCFYHRLKHMVSDKIYARSVGSVRSLTMQPAHGRSKGGALRIGEMESGAGIAAGASQVISDRMYTASDPYTVMVCNGCGVLVNSQDSTCTSCDKGDVRKARMPYAFKLLMHDLAALSIRSAVKTA